jgi:hypothetical protein
MGNGLWSFIGKIRFYLVLGFGLMVIFWFYLVLFFDGLRHREGGGLFQAFLTEEPFGIAALFPLGEVSLVDGVATEILGEDELDFRQAIEPAHEPDEAHAITEGEIDLIADMGGQTSNFSGASHGWLIDDG